MKVLKSSVMLAAICAVALCTGCPKKGEVTVTPSEKTIAIGETVELTATSTNDQDELTWTTSSASLVEISGSGAVVSVKGLAQGAATVTAKGSKSGDTDDAAIVIVAAAEGEGEGEATAEGEGEGEDKSALAQANFPSSQHGTRQGKLTWWNGEGEEAGFSSLLEPDVEIAGCTSCHAANYANGTAVDPATYAPGCGDCHVDPNNPAANPVDAPAVCKGCHGRQAAEDGLAASPNPVIAARFTDVHKTAGMKCADCHTFEEIHGDGTAYSSAYASPSPTCGGCHKDGGPEGATVPLDSVPEHTQHIDGIDCATCHIQTVISCYNCHIESLVDEHVKRAAAQANGFLLLLNRVTDGKVVPGSFQSASYQGRKMIAIGGFTTHTITADGRTCDDCHHNANVQAYDGTGEVVLGAWDAINKKVVGPAGVVPIPPDYKDAVKLDFLNYTAAEGENPAAWSLLADTEGENTTNTPDLIQIAPSLFEPLTQAQMNMLSLDMTP